MKILLQNTKTLNYVEATSGWTATRQKAQVFGTGLEAILFCLDHFLANMQVLGDYADERMNFSLPVTDHRCA